jgi:hypothetical protein
VCVYTLYRGIGSEWPENGSEPIPLCPLCWADAAASYTLQYRIDDEALRCARPFDRAIIISQLSAPFISPLCWSVGLSCRPDGLLLGLGLSHTHTSRRAAPANAISLCHHASRQLCQSTVSYYIAYILYSAASIGTKPSITHVFIMLTTYV